MTDLPAPPKPLDRFVMRPIVTLFVLAIMLLASIQVVGRAGLATAAFFEDELNQILSFWRVEITGLEGGWRGLNPYIEADKLTFGAGEFDRFRLEIDFVESIYRGDWIPRHVYWSRALIELEQVAAGWQLKNVRVRDIPFDPALVARHGDYLFGNVRLRLYSAAGPVSDVDAELLISNADAKHAIRLALFQDSTDDDVLFINWLEIGEFWDDATELTATISGATELPLALTANRRLAITRLEGAWKARNDVGRGFIDIAASLDPHPSSSSPLQIASQLDFRSKPESTAVLLDDASSIQIDAIIADTQLTHDEYVLPLSPVHFSLQIGQENSSSWSGLTSRQPTLRFWSPEIDIAGVRELLVRTFPVEEALIRWVVAMNPSGNVLNINGFVDESLGLGYSASISDVSLAAYRGTPTVANLQGQIVGHDQSVMALINSNDAVLGFPNVFKEVWPMSHVQGQLTTFFRDGVFAMRGRSIKGRLEGAAIAGGFSIYRPPETRDQQIALQLNVDQVTVERSRSFVPHRLSEALYTWLQDAPQAGLLTGVSLAYQGELDTRQSTFRRYLELAGDFAGAKLKYDADWPALENAFGQFHLTGPTTTVTISSAEVSGLTLNDSEFVVQGNGPHVEAALNGVGDGKDVLRMVRQSPLQEEVPFLAPEWQAAGQVEFQGALTIPLSASVERKADINFTLANFDLTVPEYRLAFGQLNGAGQFSLPHHLRGEFAGQLYSNEIEIAASFDDSFVYMDVVGDINSAEIAYFVDVTDDYFEGKASYSARMHFAATDADVSELHWRSDLLGMAVLLPSGLGKTDTQETPIDVTLQLLADGTVMRWHYLETRGWLLLDDAIMQGSIGLSEAPLVIPRDQSGILVTGKLASLNFEDWIAIGASDPDEPLLEWQMRNLRVAQLEIDDLAFSDVRLDGGQSASDFFIFLEGADLSGRVNLSEERIGIDLDLLRLPEPEAAEQTSMGLVIESVDPLDVAIGARLPNLWVDIDQLYLGAEPFGSWRFVLDRVESGLAITNFATDVNGVHIRDAAMRWDLAEDRTYFEGTISLDNLAETLPRWDLAPSIATQTASLAGAVNWRGSPLNVATLSLRGDLEFSAQNGRFLEADANAGGMRLVSLLNFANILRRITFDFSDVFGDGLSFDDLQAGVTLQEGLMQFNRRMKVKSPSSSYEFGGRINLNDGGLANEMVVTLPVSQSLPWYGAYLALANPLTGLGVLLGERVLRKPIEQMSSLKFAIDGTLDTPEVNLVSLFDTTISTPEDPAEQSNSDPLDAAAQPSPAAGPN